MKRMLLVALFAAAAVVGLSSASVVLAGSVDTVALAADSAVKSVTLEVQGATCAGCVVAIRRAVKGLDGVRDVQSGQAKNRLVVQYVPDKVTPKQIVEAVRHVGYGAKVTG
jgi:copper chaperone CopZ